MYGLAAISSGLPKYNCLRHLLKLHLPQGQVPGFAQPLLAHVLAVPGVRSLITVLLID